MSKMCSFTATPIKGSAANASAVSMKEVAYQIELVGKAGDLDKAEPLVEKLEEEFVKVKSIMGDSKLEI